jgi:hypothetical protein
MNFQTLSFAKEFSRQQDVDTARIGAGNPTLVKILDDH